MLTQKSPVTDCEASIRNNTSIAAANNPVIVKINIQSHRGL
ncbi:hypothetical protein [Tumebacillus flagellatus]|nr:hypothetical protein [Tumebacillus flagellatus]